MFFEDRKILVYKDPVDMPYVSGNLGTIFAKCKLMENDLVTFAAIVVQKSNLEAVAL